MANPVVALSYNVTDEDSPPSNKAAIQATNQTFSFDVDFSENKVN